MKKYKVNFALNGCDDSSYIDMIVNEAELEFLKKIEKATEECYGCQPNLEIEDLKEL